MARFLAYTSPARGHLFPILPTLLELGRRGHEISLRTLGAEVERARAALAAVAPGASVRPIAPAIETDLEDYKARTPLGAIRRAVRAFIGRAAHELPDLGAAIREERPDALFIDINSWGAAAVAEVSGLPWATFSPYFLPVPSRDAPPFGPGFAPRQDLLGRVRDRLVRALVFRWFNGPLPDLNAVRARAGAPPLDGLERACLRAPRLVYYTAEPFEYPRSDWPPSVRLVGPGIWEPEAPPPPWLALVDRPLVLVTLSTEFQDDGRLAQAALDGLAGERDVLVVVTTASVDPAAFQPPPSARVERFLPHAPLIARAACVVCHGGMGITQKALAASVPVCVVPFGRDQLEVARRVEVAGAGVRLPAPGLTPSRLRAAVRAARACREGAARVARAFAAAGGPAAAASVLEELAAGRGRTPARAAAPEDGAPIGAERARLVTGT